MSIYVGPGEGLEGEGCRHRYTSRKTCVRFLSFYIYLYVYPPMCIYSVPIFVYMHHCSVYAYAYIYIGLFYEEYSLETKEIVNMFTNESI